MPAPASLQEKTVAFLKEKIQVGSDPLESQMISPIELLTRMSMGINGDIRRIAELKPEGYEAKLEELSQLQQKLVFSLTALVALAVPELVNDTSRTDEALVSSLPELARRINQWKAKEHRGNRMDFEMGDITGPLEDLAKLHGKHFGTGVARGTEAK